MDRRTISLVQRTRPAQSALSPATLAREQMAQVGALVLDLAGLAEGKALGGAAGGFDLRHIPKLRLS